MFIGAWYFTFTTNKCTVPMFQHEGSEPPLDFQLGVQENVCVNGEPMVFHAIDGVLVLGQ